MSDNHGKFCWYELSTSDVEAAKGFYGELVGWGAQELPMGGAPYWMWLKPSGPSMGGVGALSDEAKAMGVPPNWVANVAVRDIDGTVALARELGASVVVPPMDAGSFGRFAILADPHGATFGVFQGNDPGPMPDIDRDLGGVSWHELMCDDIEAAVAFYGAIFGWKKTTAMEMGEMGTYQMFGLGETSLGGIMVRPPDMPASAWLPYFTVPSSDEAVERCKRLGGTVTMGPVEVPGGGRIAMMVDPQGAAFAVYSGTL